MANLLFSYWGNDFPPTKRKQICKIRFSKPEVTKELIFIKKKVQDDLAYYLFEEVGTGEKWNCFAEEGYMYINMYSQAEWDMFEE